MAARDIIVSAVVSAGVAAAVTWFVSRTGIADSVDVPPIVGLKAEQARALLEPRGLLLELSEERDDPRFQSGQIVEQHPLDGSRVPRGRTISAAVARATGVKMPDLANQPVGEARARLEAAKLTIGRIAEQTHPTAPPGTVIGQSAPAGADARAGSAIDLVVSKGPETAVVPNVVGRSLTKAKELLTQGGFLAGEVRHRSDEDRSDGVVLTQTPAGGVPAAKGSKVDLVVNQLD